MANTTLEGRNKMEASGAAAAANSHPDGTRAGLQLADSTTPTLLSASSQSPTTNTMDRSPPPAPASPTSTRLRRRLTALRNFLRHALGRALLRVLRLLYPPVQTLFARVKASPGLPIANPSASYWMLKKSPIARRNSGTLLLDSDSPSSTPVALPEAADIVIIGSGITGASVARTLLEWDAGRAGLRVVMLEARETCSGATGRNGGHVTPVLWQDYADLKMRHGQSAAQQIIRFRLAHIAQLLQVAKEDGLEEDSQGRNVEAFDVFYNAGLFRKAKELLEEYKRDLPFESREYKVWETREELDALQMSDEVVGCLSTRAAAMHPYRLVTGVLSRLLKLYPDNFDIFTHTPCTDISPLSGDGWYTASTPRGSIRARHIVHATNGWASHLLPGLRGLIFPARGVMTAQIPRPGLGVTPTTSISTSSSARPGIEAGEVWTGKRSFVIFPRSSMSTYDYLTQQRPTPVPPISSDTLPPATQSGYYYPHPQGELMLGGGFADALMTEIGSADDRTHPASVGAYLASALGHTFAVRRSREEMQKVKEDSHDDDEGHQGEETVKATWSGVLGFSADEHPWVGRIPTSVSGRRQLGGDHEVPAASTPVPGLAPPGEWIAAGYSGEGMVHAWMSGKALAHMLLGLDSGTASGEPREEKREGGEEDGDRVSSEADMREWFPDVFRITEERWRKAEFEELMASYIVP